MRHAIIADTGPLYAIVDETDQNHTRAVAEMERIIAEGLTVVVLYPTLMEAYTLVQRWLGIRTALRWLSDVSTASTVVFPDRKDYAAAIDTVSRYEDQDLSLFDTTVAVVSSRLALPIWTFDHHFDVLQAEVWR